MLRARVAVAALLVSGCFLEAGDAPERFKKGDLVEVRSDRKQAWGPAYVLEVDGTGYRVHHEGFDDRLDETVGPDRVRGRAKLPTITSRAPEGTTPPSASVPVSPPARYRTGDRVDVFWGDVWWKAIVTSAKGDLWRIHYDGWPEDDEIVPPSRMRAYTVKPPDGPYGAAFTALAKKDYVLAKERFRHALSQSEGDPDLWVGSARTHLALGENEAALGDATKLVSADPANVAGWVLKGDCHQALKQPREALAAFAAALRLDPDDVTARQGAAAAQGALSIISR